MADIPKSLVPLDKFAPRSVRSCCCFFAMKVLALVALFVIIAVVAARPVCDDDLINTINKGGHSWKAGVSFSELHAHEAALDILHGLTVEARAAGYIPCKKSVQTTAKLRKRHTSLPGMTSFVDSVNQVVITDGASGNNRNNHKECDKRKDLHCEKNNNTNGQIWMRIYQEELAILMSAILSPND